jgi:Flp pilus assembly protein TadD
MPEGRTSTFAMSVDDFDKSLLPANARTPGTDAFNAAVTKLLQEEYSKFGGWARNVISDKLIQVTWRHGDDDPSSQAIHSFQTGDYPTGIAMLRSLLRQFPDDSELLYNLGLALSDIGELDEAETCLQRVISAEPQNVNAIVGLGVAQQRHRRTNEAVDTLRRAIGVDGDNPWAHRNLGACLISLGHNEAGLEHLKRATELNPDDPQAWFGLGQAYELTDDMASADDCYTKVIRIDPDSNIGEQAKQRRSQIGQVEMRRRVGGGLRPDAVMYCLAALEKFSEMSKTQVQQCTVEIVMRGQRGFDFNDPAPKYEFRTLKGKFSGLQALAYMYVGLKHIAPDQDTGFDLSKEYDAAKSLYKSKGGAQ